MAPKRGSGVEVPYGSGVRPRGGARGEPAVAAAGGDGGGAGAGRRRGRVAAGRRRAAGRARRRGAARAAAAAAAGRRRAGGAAGRAGEAAGGPGAAAAPAGQRRARPGHGRRRAGRVHPAPGDRAAARVGPGRDRRRRRRRWSWTCAPGRRALALAVAACRPDAVVHAVEADPGALVWARHNIAEHVAAGGTPVTLHAADVRWTDLLVDLESRVDLVLCNPPYVPDGTPLPPEVADWDPPGAVFGGPDGLEIIRAVVVAAPPGCCATAGTWPSSTTTRHGESVPALLRRRRVLTDVAEHRDLAGRPRFATARRIGLTRSVPVGCLAVSATFDCSDPDARAQRAGRRGPRGARRRPGRAAHRHRLRPGLRRLLRRPPCARCWPPRTAARTCRCRCWSAPGRRSTAWCSGCRGSRAT